MNYICDRCGADWFYSGCFCGIWPARSSKMTVRSELIHQGPFKAKNDLASLEIVLEDFEDRLEQIDPDFPHLVIRLVVWKRNHVQGCEGNCTDFCYPSIFDVKEQSIFMPTKLPPELADHGGRNTNFITALKNVLSDVLCAKDLEARMPKDLFPFDVLSKKTFGTVEEFENALRKKGRLGAYL